MTGCPITRLPPIRAVIIVGRRGRDCTLVGWLTYTRCVVRVDGERGTRQVERRDLFLVRGGRAA